MSWFRQPGTPYVLAFIVALAFAALAYNFNSTVANFVIGIGLMALSWGIILRLLDILRHSPDDAA